MRSSDLAQLFDYSYWAARQVLASATQVPVEQFTAAPTFTYRNLRGTLVHTLDVEWSWRIRLRGEHPDLWDTSLADRDYPAVQALADHWSRDEAEMRAWVDGLSDDDLERITELGTQDRYPLWWYLQHILSHSAAQRRDAALILTDFGHAPPELEFLYYADWRRDNP
jgi:uncharacterized damage-inducible protein DinB